MLLTTMGGLTRLTVGRYRSIEVIDTARAIRYAS